MEIELYIAQLLSTPAGNSCFRAGEVLEVSHDKVNRLLNEGIYTGKDLFDKAAPYLVLEGGQLNLVDSVADKLYSDPESNPLVTKHWSGKHHKPVPGVCLVALIYTDTRGMSLPVNFRIFNSHDVFSKHDLLQQLVREVFQWGLRPRWFSAGSWYSSIENLKFLRNQKVSFLVGLKSNRTVSTQPGRYEQVKELHWHIEQMFRTIKQVCSLESFFVRTARAVNTHIFCVLRAFQRLACWTRDGLIPTPYAIRKTIYLHAQRSFIGTVVA
ncbi:MAG: transposase [Haliscomenobacter sp.]|nr:transposase [Haliscomenobacter sp.]